MVFTSRSVLLTLAMSVFLLFAMPAAAQEGQSQQSGQAVPGSAQEIKDEEIRAAASAYSEVISIGEELKENLDGVDDAEKRRSIEEDATQRQIDAIDAAGLNVGTYNRIIMEARSNDAVRERFMEHLKAGSQ